MKTSFIKVNERATSFKPSEGKENISIIGKAGRIVKIRTGTFKVSARPASCPDYSYLETSLMGRSLMCKGKLLFAPVEPDPIACKWQLCPSLGKVAPEKPNKLFGSRQNRGVLS